MLRSLKSVTLLMTCFALLTIGCGDDDGSFVDMDAGSPDANLTLDSGTPDSGTPPIPGLCSEGSCLFVADELNVAEITGGMSEGVNIDGEVTFAGDITGCGKADVIHPNGASGIDNGLGSLIPSIEMFGETDVSEVLRASIADGTLLVLFELEDVDGLNDPDVTGRLFFGTVPNAGLPFLDAGKLAPNQPFTLSMTSIPLPGAIVDGVFQTESANFQVPLLVGDDNQELIINVLDARLRAEVTENGLVNGEIGGSIDIYELANAVSSSNIGGGIDPFLVISILEGQADLHPDTTGACQRISLALTFQTVGARSVGTTPLAEE